MVSWKTNEISFIKFHINDIKVKDYLQLINNSKTQHKKHSINYHSNEKKIYLNFLNTKYFMKYQIFSYDQGQIFFSFLNIFMVYIYINMLFYFIIHHSYHSFLFILYKKRGAALKQPNPMVFYHKQYIQEIWQIKWVNSFVLPEDFF